MNRGSNAGRHLPVDILDGFNEAPIHESGKCITRTPVPARSPRFNEAPIHESGKCFEREGLPGVRGRLQ